MPTALVILPTKTYRAKDFIGAAESLGIDLVVASDYESPIDMGDRFLRIDCSQPLEAASRIVEYSDHHRLDAVVAADDDGVLVAALAGTRLGLLSNKPDAAAATRNKALQRRRLQQAEVPQPRFAVIAPGEDGHRQTEKIGFPLVVKPIDRSASQGVIRVDRPEDLANVLRQVRAIAGQDAAVIAESFAAGTEIAVEGLIQDGELLILAIIDKPGAGPGPYFPETILLTPTELSQTQQTEVARVASQAVKGLGLDHGPCHIEMKVEGDRAILIEVAARSIGGLCSQSLSFGLTGTTLETLILRNAIGLDKPELKRELKASGVYMIPVTRAGVFVSVDNLEEVQALEAITGIEITVAPGVSLLPLPEGDRYVGFVFARDTNRNVVLASLTAAAERIEVIVE